jgi:hypothetical protein
MGALLFVPPALKHSWSAEKLPPQPVSNAPPPPPPPSLPACADVGWLLPLKLGARRPPPLLLFVRMGLPGKKGSAASAAPGTPPLPPPPPASPVPGQLPTRASLPASDCMQQERDTKSTCRHVLECGCAGEGPQAADDCCGCLWGAPRSHPHADRQPLLPLQQQPPTC